MLLPIHAIRHVSAINHEGKVIIVVCTKDAELYYSVKQEGHEDNYNKTKLEGWEDWILLPISDQEADASVQKDEKERLTYEQNGMVHYIIRSVYQTKGKMAVAPVQLVSGLGHLYVFRQQNSGKIAVDRFVLDGVSNKLVPKLQVRFKRSRQRHEPMRKDKKGNDVMDAYDFKDANGDSFFEPSTELSILPATKNGWFSVVLVPTSEADRHRWHFFIHNSSTNSLEIWSIASTDEGLFDPKDRQENPGISKKAIQLDQGVQTTSVAAIRYDIQVERMTENGPQLLRDKVKVMAVTSTNKQNMAVAINFSVDADGYLSQIGEPEPWDLLKGFSKQVILPVNILDKVTGFGQQKASGVIDALNRGDEDEVWVETDPEQVPEMGDQVKISGTTAFNGLHQIVRATKNTIVVEGQPNAIGKDEVKLGRWEEQPQADAGLLFDGMVTSYRKMAGDSIRITSPKHGLKKGDLVQLVGSTDYDGVFGVQDVRKDAFSIDYKWNQSQLINIRLQSRQRRGIRFDADGDYIQTPILNLQNPTLGRSNSRTISTWLFPEDNTPGIQWVAGNQHELLNLYLVDGHVKAAINFKSEQGQTETILLTDPSVAKNEWSHYAATFEYSQATGQTQLYLLVDGAIVAEQLVKGVPAPKLKSGLSFDGTGKAYLVSSEAGRLNLKKDSFTIETWFKTSQSGPLVSYTDYQSPDGRKTLWVDGKGRLSFSDVTNTVIQSSTAYNDGEWHHVAIVANRHNQSLSMIVDAEIVATADLPNWSDDPEKGRVSLGYAFYNWPSRGNNTNFEGSLDEVRIWRKVRSLTEIKDSLYNRLSGTETYLQAYWNFEHVRTEILLEEGQEINRYHWDNLAIGEDQLITYQALKLVASPVVTLPRWNERYTLAGAATLSDKMRFFRGKLSNFQLWDRALNLETIRNQMYLELRGTESDLSVYYPMGGILRGEVIDFTPAKAHGRVHGDPYYSERTLNRFVLGDQPISSYRNEEMIAITQGAKYEETFEFRLLDDNGASIDPTNIEGEAVFAFDLWGKQSASSDERIRDGFEVLAESMEPLGDGWYKAICQFQTPNTLRVIRLFGIHQVKGESWKYMEVRKMKLTFIANSISLAESYDRISDLDVLADPGVDLNDLPNLEQQKRRLLEEKAELEGRLAKLESFGGDENAIQQRINRLSGTDGFGLGLVIKAQLNTVSVLSDPLNYYCIIYRDIFIDHWLTPPEENTGEVKLTTILSGDPALLENGGKRYWWEFEPKGSRYWVHRKRFPSDSPNPHMLRYNKVDRYRRDLYFGLEFVDRKKISPSEFSAHILDLGWAYLTGNGNKVSFSKTEKTRWNIRIADPKTLTPYGEKLYNSKHQYFQQLSKELETLIERSKWQRILDEVLLKLEAVETEISKIITDFNAEAVNQQIPDLMPFIDAPALALPTRAAYLSFVKASSRLNLTESCEGNLLLSYFDIQGRMRQTLFDATADSRNSTFEQWIPETVKSCLDFTKNDQSVIQLNHPVSLGENWTIECWFSYPFPKGVHERSNGGIEHIQDHFFFYSSDESATTNFGSPIMVHTPRTEKEQEGLMIEELGFSVATPISPKQDTFMGTGYDMRNLSHGWHHIAAQGTGSGAEGTVTFFIDGKKVGKDIRTLFLDQYPDIEAEALEQAVFNQMLPIVAIGNQLDWAHSLRHQNGAIIDYKMSQMAEIRFWDVALDAEEIEINSRSYLSANEPGLAAYYPLSEGMGNEVRNHAGFYSQEVDINGSVENARWMPSTAPIGHPGDHVLKFNGVEDMVVFSQKMKIDKSFAVEFWVKAHELRDDDFKPKPYVLFNLTGSSGMMFALCSLQDRLVLFYNFGSGQNKQFEDININDNSWHHISLNSDQGVMHFYLDGNLVVDPFAMVSGAQFTEDERFDFSTQEVYLNVGSSNTLHSFGSSLPIAAFRGQMADFRLWNRARTASEIHADRFRRLHGTESKLIIYCPLDEINEEGQVINFVSDHHGQTANNHDNHIPSIAFTNDLPIGSDAVVVCEYPTVAFDPQKNRQTAMMEKFLATPRVDKLHLLSGKRIELLEYVWIGNGQFDPTLLGYIEGPPPVPSENLTESDDYNNATSVQLAVAENVEFSWERSQDIFTELDLDAKVGVEATSQIGTVVGLGAQAAVIKRLGFESLFGIKANFQYGASDSTEINTASSLNISDQLSLRGYQEEEPELAHLGKRFIPKNIGYALVISSMADVFILRLKRSKKMVSYKILPVADIPPQINTITFMINPAYTLNGSLDGQVGSSAADDRFYSHVPEMRAQFGSKYPASYMRLDQALALEQAIEQMDKEREAYFKNFNARLVDETALDNSLKGDRAPAPNIDLGTAGENDEMDDKSEEFEEGAEKAEEQTEAKQDEARKNYDRYKDMAASSASETGMFAWKKKMEKLQIRAGKHNIVNAYVWDADGGLHISSQTFANMITHSIGGSFSFTGGLNTSIDFKLGLAIELDIAAGVGVELNMTKTESRSRDVALEVDLSGLEFRGITDDKDRPLIPGEKVDRYRFSSFYLEGHTDHFNDFFSYVVDPEWLASNDEEARALRSINQAKPNKTWRVLHRVTYVERPALLGFGRDVRPRISDEGGADMEEQVAEMGRDIQSLDRSTDQLKRKIKFLEELLSRAETQNADMAQKLQEILNALKE